MNIKGFRHTSGTYLAHAGVPIANVSARLGHSRTSTTQNYYVGGLPAGDDAAVAALAALSR
jgi:integrase